MFVTLSGIVIFSNPLQLEKAHSPISITPLGMVISVKLVQPENAPLPILVIPSGMVVFLQPSISVFVAVSMMALQLFLLS